MPSAERATLGQDSTVSRRFCLTDGIFTPRAGAPACQAPIWVLPFRYVTPEPSPAPRGAATRPPETKPTDRKSTRLNSSHANISYAVFCLKKKEKIKTYVYDT